MRTKTSAKRASKAEPAWTLDEFWKMADTEKMSTVYRVDKDLEILQSASMEDLQRVFVQYRFFTIFYISDLAFLVARLPFGNLRSSLSRFLSEELGDANPKHAHPSLYDDFLKSAGVAEHLFEKADPKNIKLLSATQEDVKKLSTAYAIGLRGMGGECLCQIYLSVMFEKFMKNPNILKIKDRLDFKFWDIHTGAEDIHHRELTRAAVSDYLTLYPDQLNDLAEGYAKGKATWDTFWSNVFAQIRKPIRAVKN